MKVCFLILFSVCVFVTACSQPAQTTNPAWLDKLIKRFESDPVGNPPLSVWRYEYNGQVVYFIPAHCCDIPSVVYDTSGNVLCSPDGGITGKGDGRCTDFFSQRTSELLIWSDSR
jgi:hypothetical protein